MDNGNLFALATAENSLVSGIDNRAIDFFSPLLGFFTSFLGGLRTREAAAVSKAGNALTHTIAHGCWCPRLFGGLIDDDEARDHLSPQQARG